MFASTTMQVRLALSAIDNGVDLSVKLMVARRSDESMSHVVLRLLAYCLFYRADLTQPLQFAPGPADRDCPDLWAHDLIGRPIEWIICGQPDVDELRHVLKHQRQSGFKVLFGASEQRQQFFHDVRSLRRHISGLEKVEFFELESQLVERLAASRLERQRWAVTLVEDHLYVDADGIAADSEVTRLRHDENAGEVEQR